MSEAAIKILASALTPKQAVQAFAILTRSVILDPGSKPISPAAIAYAKGSLPTLATKVIQQIPGVMSEFEAANNDPEKRRALVDKYANAFFAVHSPDDIALAVVQEDQAYQKHLLQRAIRYNQGELVTALLQRGVRAYDGNLQSAVAMALETKSDSSLKALVDHYGMTHVLEIESANLYDTKQGTITFSQDETLKAVARVLDKPVLEISHPDKVLELEKALAGLRKSGVVIGQNRLSLDGKIESHEFEDIKAALGDAAEVKNMTADETMVALTRKYASDNAAAPVRQ